MPRITLYEWGGTRHGEIAKRGQKFASSTTSQQMKESLLPYFSSKAIFAVDAFEDIFLSIAKPALGPVTSDQFTDPTATLEQISAQISAGKKVKKIYFSLTPACIAKNSTSMHVENEKDAEEEEEEEEEEEVTSHTLIESTHSTTNVRGETKQNYGGGSGGGGSGFAAAATSSPPTAPASAQASAAPGPTLPAYHDNEQVPEDFRARQEYERNKYTWVRSYIYEESPQYQYRNTIKRVCVDAETVVFDRTGWRFSQHPNERRFGWLFGKRHTATNEIRVHTVYEPPQQGWSQHVLLQPDAMFDRVRELAHELELDLVGCIRTRPFRAGPYGKGTEGYPTASEAMFMAAMQSKFDDGRSSESWSLDDERGSSKTTSVSSTSSSFGDGGGSGSGSGSGDVTNTRGLSFVSLVYGIEFSAADRTEWNGGLEASQVSRQMVEMYRKGELKSLKGEEFEVGTKERVFSQVKDPRFPDAAWEWKKQKKFSTMSIHLPLAIVPYKSWMRSLKMPWTTENRGNVPSKHTFKRRLEQFNTSMLDFFADFHFLIWLLEHHDEVGLKELDLTDIIVAVREGDRELCESFRPKLEALSGIGFRDPYRVDSAAPEKAHILAEQITRKYAGHSLAVLCPIRSALASTPEDRRRKYTHLSNDYGRATQKAVQEFSKKYNVGKEEACIAIVAGPAYGGSEAALMLWDSLKHGTRAAQDLAQARLREEQETNESSADADFGFGGAAPSAHSTDIDGNNGGGHNEGDHGGEGDGDGGDGGDGGSSGSSGSSGSDDAETIALMAALDGDQQIKVATLLSNAQAMGLAKQAPADVVSALKRSGWDENEAVMHLMG